MSVFVASKLPVHRFCAFTLICLITKMQRKTSVFVRSHCSVFVKPIVKSWSVFKNPRFCAFTLIYSVFRNLRFCGYPLLTAFSKTSVLWRFCADQCEHNPKNGGFSLRFCTKTEQCERGLSMVRTIAKLVRNAAEKIWNHFWCQFEIEDIKTNLNISTCQNSLSSKAPCIFDSSK